MYPSDTRPRTRRLTGVHAFTQPSLTHSSSCPAVVAAFHPSLHYHQPHHRLGLITRHHQHQHQQHLWRHPASSSSSSTQQPRQQQLVGTPKATTVTEKQPQSLAFVERIMAPRGGASNGNGSGNGKGKGRDASLWNLPNILTLMRVFAIPVLVAIFYQDVVRLPSKMDRLFGNHQGHTSHTNVHTRKTHKAWRNMACTVLFIFAAMTDWLDGYLARRLNLSSPLGAFLDPVADKVCVCEYNVVSRLLRGGGEWE